MNSNQEQIIPVIVSDITEAIVKVPPTRVSSFVTYPVPVQSVYSGPNPMWDDYYCQTFPKSRMIPAAKN